MKIEVALYIMDRQLAFSDHVPKEIRDRAYNRVKEQERYWHAQMCQELWKDKKFHNQVDYHSYETKKNCEQMSKDMAVEEAYGRRDDGGKY